MSRSPRGFMEALARRLAGRNPPAVDLPFRYVFVVAYARSGSTVLRNVLANIAGFHATGENADALGGLFFSYQSVCAAQADPAAERVDPEHYARTLARAFVDEILQPPARARIIGFHEVRHSDRLAVFDDYVGFIRTAFTPALIVFNKRDPAAIAESGWWRNYPREPLIAEIERFDVLAAAYAARHPADTVVADYDAYRRDATALRPLFDRLGVPFDLRAVQTILDGASDE